MRDTDSVAEAVREAFITGTPLGLGGAEIPAALLVGLLTGASQQPHQQQPHQQYGGGGIPALRLSGAMIRGPLDLRGAMVTALVDLTDCTFDEPVDLYAADLAGWRLTRCTLPGLRAADLRMRSELGLEQCTVTGRIELLDARIDGSLRLTGARLSTTVSTAGDGLTLAGFRMTISGVFDARGLQSHGLMRLCGARVEGNIDLGGAHLIHPGDDVFDAAGVQIGGNLRCDQKFTAEGRVVLTGATVTGNAVFSGATLHGTADEPAVLVLPRGQADSTASLAAERITVKGNLVLDAGFTAEGSVRLTNAQIGGYLRLSGATLGSPVPPTGANTISHGDHSLPIPVALAADGLALRGDLEARGAGRGPADETGALRAYGQVRLVGAQVHGSASLSGAQLHGPGLDVLFADRLRVGGTLFLRWVAASGSIRLHHAHIGSTLDCTGAHFDAPRLRADGSNKPSLDARAVTIGKDLYASRGFTATGGVRLSLAEVSKSVNFGGARLGGPGKNVMALGIRGLTCQQLVLRFAAPPRGDVLLSRVVAGAVFDGAELWAADGVVAIEDFRYESLTCVPDVDVGTRLRWLRTVLRGNYDPDPYDQLAASYRDSGHDDRADAVLLAKQKHRHAVSGRAEQVWGWLQEWTVGYGYRPWRAAIWLAVCWLLGSLWFTQHRLPQLDNEQNPAWQPVLYTADLLVPVVNLGQDGLWQASGPSAWVASVLTAMGWLLLSTAATGVTRILTRR